MSKKIADYPPEERAAIRTKRAAQQREWQRKNKEHYREWRKKRTAERDGEVEAVRAAWRRTENGKVHSLFQNARNRARRNGLSFELEQGDIVIPEYCPVLGMKLVVGEGKVHQASPQLDRIDNSKGYTKDNVIVVSKRANTIKNDATVEELCMVAEFYKNLGRLKSS